MQAVTDIKEAQFLGANERFVMSGSDDGCLYVWDRNTSNIALRRAADADVLNCVQAHPANFVIATSGIEPVIKLWRPTDPSYVPAEFNDEDLAGLEPLLNQVPAVRTSCAGCDGCRQNNQQHAHGGQISRRMGIVRGCGPVVHAAQTHSLHVTRTAGWRDGGDWLCGACLAVPP